jgi:hypothetical protein
VGFRERQTKDAVDLWEVMIRPKSYDKLGFKDLRLFNQALLAHQAM